MSASAEVRIGGGTHVVGIIGWPVSHSSVPGDPQRRLRRGGPRLGLHPIARPTGVAAARTHRPRPAGVRRRQRDDAAQDRGGRADPASFRGRHAPPGGEHDRRSRRRARGTQHRRRGLRPVPSAGRGVRPAGRSALVYGAGGAARACALALARAGLAGLTVAARDEARAAPLVKMVEALEVPVTLIRPGDTGELTRRPGGERHPRRWSRRGAGPPEPSAPRLGRPGDRSPLRPAFDRPSAASAGGRGHRVRGARPPARAGGPVLRAVDGPAGASRGDVGRRARRPWRSDKPRSIQARPRPVDALPEGMNDYSALAQRVSTSITGVRGCLMLSRDGMVLGAHPEGEAETHIRSSWMRFATVGDPERSYVEFPDQVWAFVRRGGYSAFAVADAGVRPGVLVDLLEQALMVGEQDRARDRDTMRLARGPRRALREASDQHAQAGTSRNGRTLAASAPSEVDLAGPADATARTDRHRRRPRTRGPNRLRLPPNRHGSRRTLGSGRARQARSGGRRRALRPGEPSPRIGRRGRRRSRRSTASCSRKSSQASFRSPRRMTKQAGSSLLRTCARQT